MFLPEQQLEQIQKDNNIAGMSIAVTNRDKTLYAKGFGVDSVELPDIPANPDSLYRIASITKVITGITIMSLVEKGVLDLDTPVKEYIDWLEFENPVIIKQMTLRHLLSHTSGLPMEYTPDGPREETALEESLKAELKKLKFKSLPSDGVYLYSNWGIRLASYIAQVKTGKMFSELVQEYVLEPLGMNKTTFDLRVAATYPLSLPHQENSDGKLEVVHYIKENAARFAAGGLYSNADDLCKLARFILNYGKNDLGEQVLNIDTVNQMFKRHASIDQNDGYGLTIRLLKYKDRFLCGHLGSAPPYALSVFVDHQSGYGVVTLMNTEKKDLRFKIPEMILDFLNRNDL